MVKAVTMVDPIPWQYGPGGFTMQPRPDALFTVADVTAPVSLSIMLCNGCIMERTSLSPGRHPLPVMPFIASGCTIRESEPGCCRVVSYKTEACNPTPHLIQTETIWRDGSTIRFPVFRQIVHIGIRQRDFTNYTLMSGGIVRAEGPAGHPGTAGIWFQDLPQLLSDITLTLTGGNGPTEVTVKSLTEVIPPGRLKYSS